MAYEYVVTATIPVPDDFDGQCEVRDKCKAEVAAMRDVTGKLGGAFGTTIIRRTGERPSKKPAA